jgi:serine/threonine-protein kinase
MDRQGTERTVVLPAGSTGAGSVDPLGEALLEAERAKQAGDLQGLAAVLNRYPEFRAELEEMLELEDEFGIQAPAFDPLAGLPPGPPVLERYQFLDQIGEGAFGVVFRARELGLGRLVALKVYRRGLDEVSSLLRFLEEPQVASQLDHPGIPAVHAVGKMPDGKPYVAMRLIEGDDLRGRLKRRPPLAELLAIFRQVCQIVAYAHSRGVVHRDLKPANIMVGAFGEVQVMDWGLNRVLLSAEGAPRTIRQTAVAGPLFTQDGARLGTPAYMPPEQACTLGTPTPASDVFGLGAILCELLTGSPPYCEEDGPDVFELVQRGDLTAANRRLDACGQAPELVGLTRKCLHPRWSQRPRAAEVAQAVEDHLAGLQRQIVEKQAEVARAWMYSLVTLLAAAFLVGAAGVAAWVMADRWAAQATKQAQEAARHEEVEGHLVAAEEDLRADKLSSAAGHLSEAKGRLGDGGDAEQKAHADLLRRCLVFARECDELRQYLGENGPGVSLAAPFAKLGLELPDEEEKEAEFAARARALPVRRQIVAALDHWSTSRLVGEESRLVLLFTQGEQRRWLRLARLVAGGKPSDWGQRFRSPEVRFNPEALARLAEENPEGRSVTELHVLAVALWAAKQGPVPLLRRSLVLHPNDFFLHLLMARAAGDISHARTALALRPDSLAAHEALAGCLLLLGRPEEARSHLREPLKHKPHLGTYVLEARCLIALGKLPEAESVCQTARQLYGDAPPLAECFRLLKQKRASQ